MFLKSLAPDCTVSTQKTTVRKVGYFIRLPFYLTDLSVKAVSEFYCHTFLRTEEGFGCSLFHFPSHFLIYFYGSFC